MTDWNALKNKITNAALDQPLLASLFVADFGILLFHRPPLIFSILMMGALVGLCFFYGQKLALFPPSLMAAKPKPAPEPAPTPAPAVAPAEAPKPAATATESKPAAAEKPKAAAKPKAKK